MDKALIRKRFARAGESYTKEAIVQKEIARSMTRIMMDCGFPEHPERMLEYGCGNGGFTTAYLEKVTPDSLWLNDLCAEVETSATASIPEKIRSTFQAGDIEEIPLPEQLDALVSCSTIQWLEHPEAFLHRCSQHLKPNGYWVCSTFGPDNMKEITQLTGTSLSYKSLAEWKEVLEPDFQVIHASEERIRQLFSSPMEVLRHLKATGVTGIRRTRWTPSAMHQFCEQYQQQFSAPQNGEPGVELTYHPIYLVARKR